jgi:glucose/mannose transport system permease protein
MVAQGSSAPLALTRRRKRFSIGRVFAFLVLLLVVAFYIMPIYVMVITGLKDAANVSIATMWQLPDSLSAGGYREAWDRLNPNIGTSLKLVFPATILSALIGSLNGYIFSKWRFRGSNLLFGMLLFGMFIPYQSILIPLIQALQKIGLYGSLSGLILVHVVAGIPITTLIFRNYYANIPTELVEAARVDGAGIVQLYLRVILPLSLPAFVVVGIFQFTNIWNDFLFGLTIITNPAEQPITVALNNLSGSFSVDWNVVMAGAVLAALPTALIYIFLGRFFIRGMLAGSMKG